MEYGGEERKSAGQSIGHFEEASAPQETTAGPMHFDALEITANQLSSSRSIRQVDGWPFLLAFNSHSGWLVHWRAQTNKTPKCSAAFSLMISDVWILKLAESFACVVFLFTSTISLQIKNFFVFNFL